MPCVWGHMLVASARPLAVTALREESSVSAAYLPACLLLSALVLLLLVLQS